MVSKNKNKTTKATSRKKPPAKKNKASHKSPIKKKVSVKKGAPRKTIVKKKIVAKKPPAKKSQKKYKGDAEFLASIKPYALKKTEKYMNANQKKHFLSILESWRKQLQSEQERTAEKMQENITNFPDESDRATHEEEFTLELRTRERERRLLSKIKNSLEDLKAADYGYCASCGIEIGIRRLEARPTAPRCIDCKTIEEIQERQKYG